MKSVKSSTTPQPAESKRETLSSRKPRIVFCHTGDASRWEVHNGLARDAQGHWFTCDTSADGLDTDAPLEDFQAVTLAEACRWYVMTNQFSLDADGTIAPLLKDIAAELEKR